MQVASLKLRQTTKLCQKFYYRLLYTVTGKIEVARCVQLFSSLVLADHHVYNFEDAFSHILLTDVDT